jgi:hypothetical protein
VPQGTGGRSLAIGVDFDGKRLMARTLPIAVDHWVAKFGYRPRGGCALPARPLRRGASAGLLFAVLLVTRARVLRAAVEGRRARTAS